MTFKSDNTISVTEEKPARKLTNKEKIDAIANHFSSIMKILDLDLNDDSLKDTPRRVAKMYVEEIFEGLDDSKIPNIKKFENSFDYKGIILEKNISLFSLCEHHFVPIIGKAHIGYFANKKIVGLSKLNRIVNFFSKKPQVQEKLTVQIVDFLKKELETEDVACIIDAQHLCVSMRGIKDVNSWTTTAEYSGKFLESNFKNEFLQLIVGENK
ncbi:MAG: GTP cyclohydrolase I FolE [Crocinitomicaceae bacterium]|nr:GTP cyclohydrolase I FolE [Crocinitomicaceae bacterium]|tara:strand:- start:63 stop:698 length:636 start_codon:yes stop_codon:yes gene_type:complete